MSTVRGIFTGRYVSDPAVSGDTLYATMHVCNTGCVRWGEIGWDKQPDGSRGVFVYSTDYGFYDYGSTFQIMTDQLLHMYIQYYAVNGRYNTYLWWANSWIFLGDFQLGQVSLGQTDLVYEAITDSSHLVLFNTQVDGTTLYTCTTDQTMEYSYPSSPIDTSVGFHTTLIFKPILSLVRT